jgi:hypothetical protein
MPIISIILAHKNSPKNLLGDFTPINLPFTQRSEFLQKQRGVSPPVSACFYAMLCYRFLDQLKFKK